MRYPFSNSDPTAEVTVTVTDGANPIEDAVVTFTDHDDVGVTFSGETDASGEVVIEVPLEKYDVTAKATNYVDYTHSATVTVSGDTTLTIEMEIVTDTLTVTVNDGTDPISGATVTIDGSSETTDSDGLVEFELPYGDYSATIEADGFVTATESLAFRSNHKNFTVSLEATATSGTVTITLLNVSDDSPITDADVYLYEDAQQGTSIGTGMTDENGTTTLYYDGDIGVFDFGTYFLVIDATPSYGEYGEEFVVNSAEQHTTIKLTPSENNG